MTDQPHRLRDSLRVIAELLAVAAIGWLASTVTAQTTAIAVLTQQVVQLQASLVDMPRITSSMAQMQTQIQEHDRRLTRLEDGSQRAKGWTR